MTRDDPDERRAFTRLQKKIWRVLDTGARRGPQTVVVVPSVTLDSRELEKITGAIYFEQRLLFLAQLLRQPETRVIYVTSQPLHPTIVEYALDLVASLPNAHARRRLTLLDCGDSDATPLTRKILQRPKLIEQLRAAIPGGQPACLVAFNCTPLERTLAVRLGLPLYGSDPAISYVGLKAGARKLFRSAGVPVLEGCEDLTDEHDVAAALAEIKAGNPAVDTSVIKLNDSFGGGGNVLFSYAGAPAAGLESWIRRELPRRAEFTTGKDSWERYLSMLQEMGGVAERYIPLLGRRSPAAQLEISPHGQVRVLSTHDQILGGAAKQIFLGCTFPADSAYRLEVQRLACQAGEALAAISAVGILSIDFVAELTGSGWRTYALEVNLRMGGGTAPYYILHGLVEGEYVPGTGEYLTPEGEPRCYCAGDRLQRDHYRALGPDDVLDIALREGHHYTDAKRSGAAFYMLGALTEYGKLGIVAIGKNAESASDRYHRLVAALDAESTRRR